MKRKIACKMIVLAFGWLTRFRRVFLLRRSGGLAQTRKDMIDKDVSIMKGYYKRYRGKVKDVTDTHARVELQANSKMVTVPIDAINFPGSEGQRHTTTVSGPSGARTPGRTPTREAGGMTPSHAPMTPSHGGAMTPSHYGAMTPSHYGAMTPGRETSAMTPSHPGLGVGSEMPQVGLFLKGNICWHFIASNWIPGILPRR